VARLVEDRAVGSGAAINVLLDTPDSDPARVRRLRGWDWIDVASESLSDLLEIAA
jgi:hypothetical protein